MMRDCENVLHNLFEFLDKEMSTEAVAEIRAHLELCRTCFDRMEFERLLREHFKNKTNRPCPESLKKKLQKIIESY